MKQYLVLCSLEQYNYFQNTSWWIQPFNNVIVEMGLVLYNGRKIHSKMLCKTAALKKIENSSDGNLFH